MARKNYGTLSWHNTMVVCRDCGKLTHSSNDGLVGNAMCRVCLDLSYLENSCSDNCYDPVAKRHMVLAACPDHGPEYARLKALQDKQRVEAAAQAEARGARRVARDASRVGAKLAKLAKWDALPRCKWCLSYRASKKDDRCAHCAAWGKTRPGQMEVDERERLLRERAWLVGEIEALGGTAPASPYAPEIPAR
jgi:hypothetical protein